MIDNTEGLLGIFKNWRQKRNNKDIESIYYISPKETKFFAKKNDNSIEDIIERIFQLKPELNEVLNKTKTITGKSITKSELLMYLGYIFVREEDKKIQKKNGNDQSSLIKFCSIALNEIGQRFCDRMKKIYGNQSMNDIYNAEGITEKKRVSIMQLVNVANLAYREERNKKLEVKERDERY